MPRFAVIGRVLAIAAALFAFAFPLLRYWGAPTAAGGRLALAAAAIALLGASVSGLLSALTALRARELRQRVESLLYNGPAGSGLPGGLETKAGEPLEEPRFEPVADEMDALTTSLELAARRVRVVVEALQRESARLEAILGSMVEGVVAVDPLLRITFVNRAFAEMIGASFPIKPGTPLIQVTRERALLEVFNLFFSAGEPPQKRLIHSAAARSFEVQIAPLGGDPQRGAIAMLYDITDLERLERVRKDFVANVSHELRTPLAAVCGYAETLRESVLDDPESSRDFAGIILTKARLLANIVTDLLIVSSLEGGKPPAPQPISLRESIESALRTVEATAKSRDVQLVCDPFEDVTVLGHDIRLEQVWVNLLENAIKFNRPSGEVRVVVTGDAQHAMVHVKDTGLGIPSRDLPRIFERFYRVDKARSRATGGTGLGLAIVKHAVEQMGGSVSVESRLGQGTVFTVTLPPCENNHTANGFS